MALSSTGHNLIRFYLDLDPMRLDICENCDLSMVFSSHTHLSVQLLFRIPLIVSELIWCKIARRGTRGIIIFWRIRDGYHVT
jgi:hypothetical protein